MKDDVKKKNGESSKKETKEKYNKYKSWDMRPFYTLDIEWESKKHSRDLRIYRKRELIELLNVE